MSKTEELQPGDKLYYPSIKGMALICEVVDKSDKDVLVLIDGKQYFLPKESVDSHAIIIDKTKAKVFVNQRLEDPANDLVYLRYLWDETWVDRAYNEYCRSLKRIESPFVLPKDENEPVEITPKEEPLW